MVDRAPDAQVRQSLQDGMSKRNSSHRIDAPAHRGVLATSVMGRSIGQLYAGVTSKVVHMPNPARYLDASAKPLSCTGCEVLGQPTWAHCLLSDLVK